MTNDNEGPMSATAPHLPDAEGQAALVLVESLLHGLLDQSVLTLSEAVGIVDSAIEVQAAVAEAADGDADTMWRSHSILASMSTSLKHDMDPA